MKKAIISTMDKKTPVKLIASKGINGKTLGTKIYKIKQGKA